RNPARSISLLELAIRETGHDADLSIEMAIFLQLSRRHFGSKRWSPHEHKMRHGIPSVFVDEPSPDADQQLMVLSRLDGRDEERELRRHVDGRRLHRGCSRIPSSEPRGEPKYVDRWLPKSLALDISQELSAHVPRRGEDEIGNLCHFSDPGAEPFGQRWHHPLGVSYGYDVVKQEGDADALLAANATGDAGIGAIVPGPPEADENVAGGEGHLVARRRSSCPEKTSCPARPGSALGLRAPLRPINRGIE